LICIKCFAPAQAQIVYMFMPLKAVLLAMCLLIATGIARAEDPAAGEGRVLAETNCAACHALGKIGDSPFAAAPPFRDVASRYTEEELLDGFMEGLPVRHEAMPDWDMTEDQAIALTLFIMSLAK
jgi:cytochrome c